MFCAPHETAFREAHEARVRLAEIFAADNELVEGAYGFVTLVYPIDPEPDV